MLNTYIVFVRHLYLLNSVFILLNKVCLVPGKEENRKQNMTCFLYHLNGTLNKSAYILQRCVERPVFIIVDINA